MVMDYIRSAYEVDMQFDAAGSIVRRVRWFFAAPGAKRFPLVNPFFSGNWGDLRGGPAGPGEVWSSDRPWSNGARPAPLQGKGQFCGDPDWWLDGTPSNAPDLPTVNGIPLCCGTAGIQGNIGVKVGVALRPLCLADVDFRGSTLTCFAGTFGPTQFQVAAASLWYIQNATVGGPYFEAFHSPGTSGCLSSNVVGTAGFCSTEDPVPFVGFYQGDTNALVFQASQSFQPVPNALFIVNVQPRRYGGHVGVAVAPTATGLPIHYHGEIGILVGVVGTLTATFQGNAGVEVGIAGELVGHVPATVGIMVSPAGSERARVVGHVGVKVGPAGGLHHRYLGAVGVKVAPTMHARRKVSATVGVKVSPTATLFTGVVKPCCPGVVIKTTLTGTDGSSNAITATYNASSGFWQYTDPTSSFLITLQCVNPGSGFVWQLSPNVTAHCSVSHTLHSVTCHPFSIDVQCTATGALCIEAGTYRAILS